MVEESRVQIGQIYKTVSSYWTSDGYHDIDLRIRIEKKYKADVVGVVEYSSEPNKIRVGTKITRHVSKLNCSTITLR